MLARNCDGQDSLTIRIVDSQSLEPLPSTQIEQGSKLFLSDKLGKARIPIEPKKPITVSRLGYHLLHIDSDTIPETIYMISKSYGLPEITVAGFSKSVELGCHNLSVRGYRLSMKQPMGVSLLNPYREGLVQAIILKTKGNRKGYSYEVAIYRMNENTEPEDCIYKQEYTTSSAKNRIEIPVKAANLKMASMETFLVTVRWLPPADAIDEDGPKLKYTDETSTVVSYSFVKNEWHRMFQEGDVDYLFKYQIGLKLILI